MGKRPTIQQVAELAGVSRGTVDRVVNGRSYVKEEVRQRVMEAVREAGYMAPREAHRQTLELGGAPLKLGVVLPSWTGFWRRNIETGIKKAQEELADFGTEILLEVCQTDIPQEAVERMDALVAAGAAGLALCIQNDPLVHQRVAELAEAGVPCVTFNSDLSGSRRLCFVGQDIRKSGRVAGELMFQCIPAGGRVLATLGNLKFDGHRLRLEGFCERLEELGIPRDQVLVAETYNDYATAARVVAENLGENADIRGIYMANRSVAACAEAVRAAGLEGQVRIICHDVNESTRRLLLEGRVAMTIPQDLEQQGYAPLVLLRELLQKGKAPDPERYNSRIAVVCAENL